MANTAPRENQQWFWFETPWLARDVRIFGEIKVELWLTVEREWVTFTPTIVDFDASPNPHGPVSATRGWLDARYRNGLSQQVPIEPGDPFGMTVVEKPQDYTFAKGHRIGLNIQTEIVEWNVPKLYGCWSKACAYVRVNWEKGKTRVVLPVVGAGSAEDLFEAGRAAVGRRPAPAADSRGRLLER